MKDIRYLLSIKELLEGSSTEQLAEQACTKLDKERSQRLKGMKHGKKYAESLGAGLLLQLGMQELSTPELTIQYLTVSQVLARLGEPIDLKYTYGEYGKPYFKYLPVYFNISHSGDYVFCVFSEQEIGADIQYRKSLSNDRIVRRFFTRSEQEMWDKCTSLKERERLFYHLWTRKEAYGKLTGEGIAKTASVDVNSLDISWEDYEIADDYQIAVCKRIV